MQGDEHVLLCFLKCWLPMNHAVLPKQSFPLHHFEICLYSEDELCKISSNDIETDEKTISGANYIGTSLPSLQQFTSEILHKY